MSCYDPTPTPLRAESENNHDFLIISPFFRKLTEFADGDPPVDMASADRFFQRTFVLRIF